MVNQTSTIDRWQPITTVTKQRNGNGRRIDLWLKWWDAATDTFKGKRVTDCYWHGDRNDGCWKCTHDTIGDNVRVTHWRDVPDSPETEAALDAPKAPPAPTLPDPMEVPPEYREPSTSTAQTPIPPEWKAAGQVPNFPYDF